ncbi:MAG: hypothetical protein Rubg2KO_04880 [Rubricoccaceae bacterium]
MTIAALECWQRGLMQSACPEVWVDIDLPCSTAISRTVNLASGTSPVSREDAAPSSNDQNLGTTNDGAPTDPVIVLESIKIASEYLNYGVSAN